MDHVYFAKAHWSDSARHLSYRRDDYEIEDYYMYVGESVGRLDRVELFCVRHHRIIHVPLLSVDRRTSHEYNYYFV